VILCVCAHQETHTPMATVKVHKARLPPDLNTSVFLCADTIVTYLLSRWGITKWRSIAPYTLSLDRSNRRLARGHLIVIAEI